MRSRNPVGKGVQPAGAWLALCRREVRRDLVHREAGQILVQLAQQPRLDRLAIMFAHLA